MTRINALVIGENTFPFHALDEMAPHINAVLSDVADAELTTDRTRLEDLSGYDIVVDYLTDSTLTDEQYASLQSFVADGGGYLGIHCAADLTSTSDGNGGIKTREEPIPELRELLRGHFVDHPEQSMFGVDLRNGDHPVTANVADFEVFDEPYQVDFDNEEVHVLAWMDHPDLDRNPVVWVREYGDGRVCYSSLGHTVDAFEHEQHGRLLRNAVRWIADAQNGQNIDTP
ncbi:ThuA domain-containing protein [Haladaptatus salinisoli]|uniref:ThuA domain-containing protein n=1 Tax=Haladaptatus salinisoli TaxID=2884876 RepID=UPI001D0A81EE|nr:ThuA domain-containing protein [Haladaptatus salinisoli]